jgi:galactose oxidase-like protein
VTITSSLVSISVRGTDQFMATARDGSGGVMTGVTLNWASSNSGVATIDAATGVATGLLPGTTQITVSANGLMSNPISLTVTPGFLSIVTLNVARSDMTITVLNNGLVLIAGGDNSGGVTSTAELYNPATQTFTLTGSLNTARFNHTATLLDNGMVLIAGGTGASDNRLASAELYNPATEMFTPTGNMIVVREQPTATHLQSGKVLIAGGNGLNGALNTAELYDPTTEEFTPAGTMHVTRRAATATLLNDGTVLIAGGVASRGAILGTAELYDPETNSFTLTGRMIAARAVQTATLLNSGMVLIAGGAVTNGAAAVPLASAELYDPAKGTFTLTGSLIEARTNASATLLNNGTVLFAGGDGPGNPNLVPLTSAEVYDPIAGTFADTGSLQVPRLTRTAPLLPNGTVLFAGGFQLPTAKAPAELYEPGPLTPPGLQSIAVSPGGSTVSPGAYQPYIATGTFASGTQQLAAVTWSSSDTTTAPVSNDASNPGASVAVRSPSSTATVTITAAAGTVSGSSMLNIRPAGFVTTGSMSVPREVFQAVPLNNGLVLVVDGDGLFTGPLPAELYNLATGAFTLTGVPLAQRYSYTATLLPDGMVLIAGGNFGSALASAELYDPSSGKFSATGNLNVARYDHTATLLVNGTVLITGGRTTGGTAVTSAEIYDPGSGMFTPAGNLSFARAEHTATPIAGGNVLIAGGQLNGGSFPASAELYNAFSGLFSVVGNLNVPRFFHTSTLLPNGTVLIAGGVGIGSILTSAELFNPATGTFSFTGSLNTARSLHTATLLDNGKVLVAGGGNNLSPTSGTLASAELYDPVTASFTSAGALNTARINHAAALLSNGMALITGGAGITVLSSSELY